MAEFKNDLEKYKNLIYKPESEEWQKVKFNLAHFINKSLVNGPGERSVAWIGGCLRGCFNCFNPELWSFKERNLLSPEELAEKIISCGSPGFTLSGGDPLDSPVATLRLLKALHNADGNLNPALKNGIIMFTGFTIEEINQNSLYQEIIKFTDLTIEGRYVDELKVTNGLHGSSNQRFIWNESPGRGKVLVQEDKVIFDQDIEIHTEGDKILVTGFPTLNKESIQELKNKGIEISYK